MTFVFSADGHITEPSDLLTEGLPASLRPFGLRAEKQGEYLVMLAGDKETRRRPINRPPPVMAEDGQQFGRASLFQYDRACIMARSVTGVKPLLWGSDYPHREGAYPKSREVVAHLFDDIEISEQDRADILGRNAARLFRLPRPELLLQAA